MGILITSQTERTPGPQVNFACPKCGREVVAQSYGRVEKMGVFYLPLITQRETCVECECGTLRLTRLPLESLGGYSAAELAPHLYERTSIIVQFVAVASVLLSCVPPVGLVLAVGGLLG